MKVLDEFKIPFTGLRQGIHYFDFEIDNKFFGCFEDSEITNGKLKVKAELDRKSVLLIFNLKVIGKVTLPCDRCGDDFEMKIKGELQIIAKLNTDDQDAESEVIYLGPKDTEVDLSHSIYEMIVLAIPYQRAHPDGKCNKEALGRIKLFSSAKEKKTEVLDPRWDALKQLKFKKK